jgi:hypothetical protein
MKLNPLKVVFLLLFSCSVLLATSLLPIWSVTKVQVFDKPKGSLWEAKDSVLLYVRLLEREDSIFDISPKAREDTVANLSVAALILSLGVLLGLPVYRRLEELLSDPPRKETT